MASLTRNSSKAHTLFICAEMDIINTTDDRSINSQDQISKRNIDCKSIEESPQEITNNLQERCKGKETESTL